MSNRPLTLTEGMLCGWIAVLLGLLQAHWTGFYHWYAIVACVFTAITAAATMLRHAVGEQRLASWRGSE